jgi:hypothetical protein
LGLHNGTGIKGLGGIWHSKQWHHHNVLTL